MDLGSWLKASPMSFCTMDNAIWPPCDAIMSQCTIWTRICVLAHTPTTFSKFKLPASNEAATSASSRNKFDPHRSYTYETCGTYETDQKALDQTDAENCADLFRVHVLRRRDLIQ